MSNEPKPTKNFGYLLAVLGVAFTIGGIDLVRMGDNFYFVVFGLGFLTSGVLVSRGKLLGAYVYAVTFAVIVLWSLLEVGANAGQLLPRLLMPTLVGLYIFVKVHPRLAEQDIMDGLITSQPKAFSNAVSLLWLALALSLIRVFISPKSDTMLVYLPLAYVVLALIFFLKALLVYKIAKRRNWARISYLVIVVIGIFHVAPSLISEFGRAPIGGLLGFAVTAIQIVAVYLLFTSPCNALYKNHPNRVLNFSWEKRIGYSLFRYKLQISIAIGIAAFIFASWLSNTYYPYSQHRVLRLIEWIPRTFGWTAYMVTIGVVFAVAGYSVLLSSESRAQTDSEVSQPWCNFVGYMLVGFILLCVFFAF